MTDEVEEFRDIMGFEGLYLISSLGRVYSLPRITPHGHKKKGKFLKTSIPRDNLHYPNFATCKDGVPKTMEVHVAVAKAFIPNPDNLPEINHKDGVKVNCVKNNLEWSTHKENIRHGFRTGLTRPNRTSRFTGVYRHPVWSRPWVAICCIKRKIVLSEAFNTELEAAARYNDFVISNDLDNPLNDLTEWRQAA